MVLFYLFRHEHTDRKGQFKKTWVQFCENIRTKWTDFIIWQTGFIRQQSDFIRRADEASPPADEASPPAVEASPPANEASPPPNEASSIGPVLKVFPLESG